MISPILTLFQKWFQLSSAKYTFLKVRKNALDDGGGFYRLYSLALRQKGQVMRAG